MKLIRMIAIGAVVGLLLYLAYYGRTWLSPSPRSAPALDQHLQSESFNVATRFYSVDVPREFSEESRIAGAIKLRSQSGTLEIAPSFIGIEGGANSAARICEVVEESGFERIGIVPSNTGEWCVGRSQGAQATFGYICISGISCFGITCIGDAQRRCQGLMQTFSLVNERPRSRFALNGNTIEDYLINATWSFEYTNVAMNYDAANWSCQSKGKGWRVPHDTELKMLMSIGQNSAVLQVPADASKPHANKSLPFTPPAMVDISVASPLIALGSMSLWHAASGPDNRTVWSAQTGLLIPIVSPKKELDHIFGINGVACIHPNWSEPEVVSDPNALQDRYKVMPDGTVLDKQTKLRWYGSDGVERDWDEAERACSEIPGSWRLPSAREALTLWSYLGPGSYLVDGSFYSNKVLVHWGPKELKLGHYGTWTNDTRGGEPVIADFTGSADTITMPREFKLRGGLCIQYSTEGLIASISDFNRTPPDAGTTHPNGADSLFHAEPQATGKKPSFDCRMASTDIEVAICADRSLSALDGDLGRIYARIAQSAKNIKSEQNDWIRERNRACGPDADCLSQWIRGRIAHLESRLTDDAVPHRSTEASSFKADDFPRTGEASASNPVASGLETTLPYLTVIRFAGLRYPPKQLRAGREGKVVLRVLVSSTGRIESIHIEESSGHEDFDRAAEKAIRKSTVMPPSKEGGWGLVLVRFSIGD